MNGTDTFVLPEFLIGESLPEGYFDPVDPYQDAPVCNYKVGAIVDYARRNGKKCWELTKEELEMFRTVSTPGI